MVYIFKIRVCWKKRAKARFFINLDLDGQEMIPQEIIDRVRQLADPILTTEGFELVEVEFRREARGWVLRLYVDKEGGITLDDCTGSVRKSEET